MIEKLEVQGIHMTVDEAVGKYVQKKIGQLDKYMPKAVRNSVHAEVLLKEGKADNNNHCTCEVTLYLPKETININESTVNIYAAIDIVETKLKQRIQKYKDLHNNGKLHRRLFAKFNRRSSRFS